MLKLKGPSVVKSAIFSVKTVSNVFIHSVECVFMLWSGSYSIFHVEYIVPSHYLCYDLLSGKASTE